MSFVFIFPPRNTFSTPRTPTLSLGSLARSVHTSIHPPIPLHQLRPRTLEHPQWCSSIVAPATALLHHTSSAYPSPPQSRSRNLSPGAPIHSGHRVILDSARLCLSPPFPSQWRRFTLPPYDIKSGVDDLEPVQRVRIHRDPRPSVDFKLLFQAPMRAKKSNLPHHKERGASSP